MDQSQALSITPGMLVINKLHKDWGIGQVQSSINEKITINFEHVGKKVINIKEVPLEIVNTKIQNESMLWRGEIRNDDECRLKSL